MSYQLLQGDCLEVMRTLPAGSVQCCITSPPYFGLRDYQTATWEGGDPECDHSPSDTPAQRGIASSTLDGGQATNGHRREGYRGNCPRCGARRIDQQIGLEETPEQYCAKLVDVFREVRRLLRDDGTLWLNLGDSYNGSGGAGGDYSPGGLKDGQPKYPGRNIRGLGPKQLLGIPWRTAFALQADGWILRSEIIWHKRAPMPESVTDRPTKAHEQLFLLAKSQSYYYDQEAIAEPAQYGEEHHRKATSWGTNRKHPNKANVADYAFAGDNHTTHVDADGNYTRNRRSVWTLGPESYSGAHFATMPTKLVEPCILAGTSAKGCCAQCGAPWVRVVELERNGESIQNPNKLNELAVNGAIRGGVNNRRLGPNIQDKAVTLDWQPSCSCSANIVPCTVLDCFNGSGTTGAVALKHHRNYIGIDLNRNYIELAHDRIRKSQPMLLEAI